MPEQRSLLIARAAEHEMDLLSAAINLELQILIGEPHTLHIASFEHYSAVVAGAGAGAGGRVALPAHRVAIGLQAQISGLSEVCQKQVQRRIGLL